MEHFLQTRAGCQVGVLQTLTHAWELQLCCLFSLSIFAKNIFHPFDPPGQSSSALAETSSSALLDAWIWSWDVGCSRVRLRIHPKNLVWIWSFVSSPIIEDSFLSRSAEAITENRWVTNRSRHLPGTYSLRSSSTKKYCWQLQPLQQAWGKNGGSGCWLDSLSQQPLSSLHGGSTSQSTSPPHHAVCTAKRLPTGYYTSHWLGYL